MTPSSTPPRSVKRKVLAGAAMLTIVGGLCAVPTGAASAATPECGPTCISVFSSELGTYADPNFVEAVLGAGAAEVGQPVGLKRVSGTDPSQDFLPGGATGGGTGVSTVSDFYADGMVSAAVNRRYGHLDAVQQKYAPFRVESGLCVGLASVAHQNQGLTLQPCDVPGTTVWIVLPVPAATPYFAIVNASTTDFSRPFAMHLPRNEVASGRPLQMQVRRLQFRTARGRCRRGSSGALSSEHGASKAGSPAGPPRSWLWWPPAASRQDCRRSLIDTGHEHTCCRRPWG